MEAEVIPETNLWEQLPEREALRRGDAWASEGGC